MIVTGRVHEDMARYIVRDGVGEDKEDGLLITGEKRVKIRKTI